MNSLLSRRFFVTVALLSCAFVSKAASDWEVGPVIDWMANTSNLLSKATIDDASLAQLADGKLEEFGSNGNIENGKIVTWTLPNASTIYGVNVFTK